MFICDEFTVSELEDEKETGEEETYVVLYDDTEIGENLVKDYLESELCDTKTDIDLGDKVVILTQREYRTLKRLVRKNFRVARLVRRCNNGGSKEED